MKPDPTFWFGFSLSIILCQIEKLIGGDPHYVRKVQEDDTLNPLKPKYQEYSKEEDVFPVTFQASTYSSYDFWRNNRRTFFEPHKKDKTPPELYRMMTSFFGETKSPNLFRGTFAFEKSFTFKPTDHSPSANYIPSPKPIRASVIKLETVTKSPNLYSPFSYETATKYFPPLGNLLNHVLIENAKIHDAQDLSFHYRPNPAERVNSTSDIFLTVLPKPIQVPPTTLRPLIKFSTFFNKKKNNAITFAQKMGYSVHNANEQRYTSSGQSKNFSYENIKIPYFSDAVLDTLNATLSHQQPTKISYLKYILSNKKNSSMNLKDLNWVIPNAEPIPAAISSIVKISSFDTTTLKPLQKGLKPSNKSSIEIITNLTNEGLSATKKNNANIQNYLNFYNIKNLINYEVKRMETTTSSTKKSDEFKLHSVNFNDELSLDAKILKDTNWDNLTTSKSSILVENERDTFQIKNKIDEKEIITTEKPDETILTEFSDSAKLTTFIPSTVEEIFETTTRINFPTKVFLKSTKTNTNEMFSTIKNLHQTPGRYDIVLETSQTNSLSYETTKETTQEPVIKPVSEEQIIETTTVSTISTAESISTTFPKRNYRRRSKVINSVSPTDFQKKALNRNNFPKRQKPNITLTFGNKINIKSREEYERNITKFSGDAVGKRKRKSGKRRRVIRVQIPKVETPVSNTESIL